MKFKILLFLILFIGGSAVFAQQKGIVTGLVVDASLNNETMPAVSVVVQGTKLGANTDADGKFRLELDPGTHILVFSYVGYQTLRDTIVIQAGKQLNLGIAMASDAQVLDNVVITGEVRKDTESALLRKQMNSAVITQSVGAQEMSRKGLSNAATALIKVTGIAKQEGTSGVFVRGLGDRYNNTLLNGLPLPSNEPTAKNIALDMFQSDVIQSLGISKIYTADTYGDVGGATVNIESKEHIGKPFFEIEIGTGLNTNAFRSDFKRADNINRFGFYNIKTPTTRSEYTFESRWSPKTIDNPFNYNFALAGGKSFIIGSESRLNLFATASHTTDYTYRSGFEKVMGDRESDVIKDYFHVQKFGYTTNTTGMLNLAYRINPLHNIKLNSIFVNGSLSSVNEYDFIEQSQTNDNFSRQTLTQQNQLLLNQLLGEHQLSDHFSLEWAGSYGIVNADMPDRITNTLTETNEGNSYIFNSAALNSNNRYFQHIKEKEWAARAAINYKFDKGTLSLGYNGRSKQRDFDATQFNIRINGGSTGVSADPNDIDAFINPSNLSSTSSIGTFTIQTARGGLNLTPWTYQANIKSHGGYLNFEHHPNDKLTYTLGFRADKIKQDMTWDVNIRLPSRLTFDDATIDKLFFLPEATLKYALTDVENLRLAASKTYTLPQFLEKSPFQYDDVTLSTRGNAYVKPADNYNLDFKWEKFPSPNELLSAVIFGKYIVDPISQSTINAATPNLFSFVNAGDHAYILGAEFEVRKNIDRHFSGGANLTYMYTRQELDPDKIVEDTEGTLSVNYNTDHDHLQGGSPLLANADITYKSETGRFRPTISLVGNYFYDRIFSLGSFGRGNIIEKGYPSINLVSSAEIGERWHVGLKINNLTNSHIRMVQENKDKDVDTYSFKRGLDFSIGLKYRIIK